MTAIASELRYCVVPRLELFNRFHPTNPEFELSSVCGWSAVLLSATFGFVFFVRVFALHVSVASTRRAFPAQVCRNTESSFFNGMRCLLLHIVSSVDRCDVKGTLDTKCRLV